MSYYIKAKQSLADSALGQFPDDLALIVKRGHALAFLGRTAEAKAVYLEHKDKRVRSQSYRTWKQVDETDFKQLRKAGLEHPLMAEVEQELGIAKK